MNVMTATEAVISTIYGEGFELDLEQPTVVRDQWDRRSWRHPVDILLIDSAGSLHLFKDLVRVGFGSFKSAESGCKTRTAIDNPTPARTAMEMARHDLVIVPEPMKRIVRPVSVELGPAWTEVFPEFPMPDKESSASHRCGCSTVRG